MGVTTTRVASCCARRARADVGRGVHDRDAPEGRTRRVATAAGALQLWNSASRARHRDAATPSSALAIYRAMVPCRAGLCARLCSEGRRRNHPYKNTDPHKDTNPHEDADPDEHAHSDAAVSYSHIHQPRYHRHLGASLDNAWRDEFWHDREHLRHRRRADVHELEHHGPLIVDLHRSGPFLTPIRASRRDAHGL
jgi:hypothetical protein